MIVILNNGTRISLPHEAVQSIQRSLMTETVTQWQSQIDVSTSRITSIVNLKEVSAICEEDAIQTALPKLIAALDMFKESLPNKDQTGIFWAEKFRQYLVELK